MKHFASIDPGGRYSAIAHFAGSELLSAFLFDMQDPLHVLFRRLGTVDEVVIERMVVRTLKNARDLIDLSIVGGRLSGAIEVHFHADRFEYLPNQWKGNTPKKVHNKRTIEKLSPAQLERVELPRAQGLHHNLWDAVGLGLYHNERGRKITLASKGMTT